MSASFDQPAFAAAIAAVITARQLSDRQVAEQTGLAPSTITRAIRQGKTPDVDSLAALADWAALPVDAFIIRTFAIRTPMADDIRRTIAAMRASEAAMGALQLLLASGQPESCPKDAEGKACAATELAASNDGPVGLLCQQCGWRSGTYR